MVYHFDSKLGNIISVGSSKGLNETFTPIIVLFNANNNHIIVACEFGEILKKNM
jgi:hypothetical protein